MAQTIKFMCIRDTTLMCWAEKPKGVLGDLSLVGSQRPLYILIGNAYS